MIINRQIPAILITMLFLCIACKQNEGIKQTKNSGDEKESLIRVNEYLVEKDKEIIENYVNRREWEMEVTESGLWYMVYEAGDGKMTEQGNLVALEYSVSLLDGTLCYHSDESGPLNFVVGRGGVEAGLEEGILLLRVGDKARFILPPHLAYGLLGDENKIPARSVIIYDLTLTSVTE